MTGHTPGEILEMDSSERILESKTYAFQDEFWDGTDCYDIPAHYNWHYEEIELGNESTLFEVFGSILEEELNTSFSFKKAFKTFDSARYYFDLIKIKKPKSNISIIKRTYQYISSYH